MYLKSDYEFSYNNINSAVVAIMAKIYAAV
jgi:hypothetical protein